MLQSQEEVADYYKKLFDHEEVRNNLALAGLYLATFEVLKSIVVGNIRSFYAFDFPDEKGEWDAEKIKSKQYLKATEKFYRSKKDGDEFRACGLWLVDSKVINQDEANELLDIRTERNTIAHELPDLLLDPQKTINGKLLARALALVNKIDRWWIVEVEIPTNPDHDGREIDEQGVLSGRMVYMNHVVQMFLKNYPDIQQPEN